MEWKNGPALQVRFFGVGSSVLLDVQNLFSVIEAAHLAYAVILYECVASRVGAFVNAGHRELAVVGASLVSAGLGYFFLRYCHVYTSSNY